MVKLTIDTLNELRNILEHTHHHISLQIQDLDTKLTIVGVIGLLNLFLLILIFLKTYHKE